jgi:hypothetical protein
MLKKKQSTQMELLAHIKIATKHRFEVPIFSHGKQQAKKL